MIILPCCFGDRNDSFDQLIRWSLCSADLVVEMNLALCCFGDRRTVPLWRSLCSADLMIEMILSLCCFGGLYALML